MKLLLDTHILLWSLFDPSRVNHPLKASITLSSNQVFVSGSTC